MQRTSSATWEDILVHFFATSPPPPKTTTFWYYEFSPYAFKQKNLVYLFPDFSSVSDSCCWMRLKRFQLFLVGRGLKILHVRYVCMYLSLCDSICMIAKEGTASVLLTFSQWKSLVAVLSGFKICTCSFVGHAVSTRLKNKGWHHWRQDLARSACSYVVETCKVWAKSGALLKRFKWHISLVFIYLYKVREVERVTVVRSSQRFGRRNKLNGKMFPLILIICRWEKAITKKTFMKTRTSCMSTFSHCGIWNMSRNCA